MQGRREREREEELTARFWPVGSGKGGREERQLRDRKDKGQELLWTRVIRTDGGQIALVSLLPRGDHHREC